VDRGVISISLDENTNRDVGGGVMGRRGGFMKKRKMVLRLRTVEW
jgi:hypothetical protein